MENILIFGGTGTLGQATTCALLDENPTRRITIFSRSELNQKMMAASLPKYHKVKFVIGDIRDRRAVKKAVAGKDLVFHFAALKHVDLGEDNVEEFIKTNIQGTINIADACIESKVPKMIFSSTDKAVDPINVYGNCKAISEKLLLSHNENKEHTRFFVFRWGNVLGSNGSAILSFAKDLIENKRVFITDPRMTRFWIQIEDAVKFMIDVQKSDINHNKVFIPAIGCASIEKVVEIIAEILVISKYKTIYTGIRKGEKLHESLVSGHDANPIHSDRWQQLSDLGLKEILTPVLKLAFPERFRRLDSLKVVTPPQEINA